MFEFYKVQVVRNDIQVGEICVLYNVFYGDRVFILDCIIEGFFV